MVMASGSSMAVSVECVNVCKFWNGDVSGKYDSSMLSCASKTPRALTRFLASTAHPPQASGRIVKRNRVLCICQVHHWRRWSSNEASNFATPPKFLTSTVAHFTGSKWKLCYSPSSSSESYEVSPDSLWEDLSRSISCLPSEELELVRKALNLAFVAHDGQKRRSGEPFIIHPVAVAQILGELELDWESIAAGLLHDTVEDTNLVTFERIEEDFGTAVRHIVEEETKVSKIGNFKSKDESYSIQDGEADDLHQMFLAMTEESSIAMETLQVFAPLAKLLGIYQIKSERENLAFMYTNLQDYAKVNRRLAELYQEHEKDLKEANTILKKRIEDDQFLDLMTMKTEFRAVCKEPYR